MRLDPFHRAPMLVQLSRVVAGLAFGIGLCWFVIPQTASRSVATIVLLILANAALFASLMTEERAANRLSRELLKANSGGRRTVSITRDEADEIARLMPDVAERLTTPTREALTAREEL